MEHEMKLLFENWRKFIQQEKKFSDYNAPKNKWVNIPIKDIKPSEEETSISDELFDLIQKSYSSIGGHIDFKSPDDLPGNHQNWSAIDVDNDPDPEALRVSKKGTGGNKLTVGASDGSSEGKKAYLDKTAELLSTQGNYGELSDAVAHVMITRYNVPFVDNPEDVQKLLGADKPIKWIGLHPNGKYPNHPGWYVRKLGGEEHMKIMLGKPNV